MHLKKLFLERIEVILHPNNSLFQCAVYHADLMIQLIIFFGVMLIISTDKTSKLIFGRQKEFGT